jgi:hypothetical protein
MSAFNCNLDLTIVLLSFHGECVKGGNVTLLNTVPISYRKIVERGKIYTPNTQIHDSSLSWLGTGTVINSGRVRLVL